jgi:hypothetical protein
MGKLYFSPVDGNAEYYEEKPEGYYEEYADYIAENPPNKVTFADKLVHISNQYVQILRKLEQAYEAAHMRDDVRNMEGIKREHTAMLLGQLDNEEELLHPEQDIHGIFCIPATTRCVGCGNKMVLTTFPDDSEAMVCPVCEHCENADAANRTDTPGKGMNYDYCGVDMQPRGPGLGDGK